MDNLLRRLNLFGWYFVVSCDRGDDEMLDRLVSIDERRSHIFDSTCVVTYQHPPVP